MVILGREAIGRRPCGALGQNCLWESWLCALRSWQNAGDIILSLPHPNPLPEGEGGNLLREFHSKVHAS
jgi:hypothetical protein